MIHEDLEYYEDGGVKVFMLPRDATAIPCECGGYAGLVDGTQEERELCGCGRSYDCCNAAFVCISCQKRWVASLDAPEME